MVEARAGRYGPAALEALTAGDQSVAAFLRGLDLFGRVSSIRRRRSCSSPRGRVATSSRRRSIWARCFASVGRDRDAAGVWQMALGAEPRPAVVYTMVADARLRDGQPGSAIDILKPAYERDPANDEIGRRLAIAYAMTGRFAEALPAADKYLERHPTDQDMLLAAITSQYEAVPLRSGAVERRSREDARVLARLQGR